MAEATRSASITDEIASQAAFNAEAVLKLRNAVRKSPAERQALLARLAALADADLPKEEKSLREAAYNWITGHLDAAEAALKGSSSALAKLVRGGIALERGQHDEAISELQAAQALSPAVSVELAAAWRGKGQPDEGLKVLAKTENANAADSGWWLQKGWCAEAFGQQETACDAYEKALELDPQNPQAAFRLAYLLDLRGEDARAVELYRKVAGQGTAFVNAMLNLGLLYEDRDEVDNAIACFKDAMKVDPGNRRAALYLRNAVESLDMYYDEAQRKEHDRLEAVLRIAINDFELSVRSRNCLAKMNVRTLGDLVRKTEPELLAYKNFGETSLREIRSLLESKGLRLGMQRDEEERKVRTQRLRLGGGDNPILAKPAATLELSVRSRKCMQRLAIDTIGDLLDKTEADLLATKNFGQTSLNEVKAKLSELGLTLKASD
ncbi:MAG: DNA-directed RNA polymerase subunit alpha C-terminal domain-containing protein [Planctomycetota bacterium]